jgi:hypothetical protein
LIMSLKIFIIINDKKKQSQSNKVNKIL